MIYKPRCDPLWIFLSECDAKMSINFDFRRHVESHNNVTSFYSQLIRDFLVIITQKSCNYVDL